MVRRKSQKKSVRKPKRSTKHKTSRNTTRVSKFRMGSPEKLNLTTLPPDILYSISRSLTPIDRSCLVSTSKSIRANKSIIYQDPIDIRELFKHKRLIKITNYSELNEYLNYLKFLVAYDARDKYNYGGANFNYGGNKTLHCNTVIIHTDYSVNDATIIERWFQDIIDVVGEAFFTRLRINIGYFYMNNNYTITFDYDKYKRINIYSIYMLDIDTVKNINFLKALDGMNVDRILYKNINEDVNICKYLCKVKTVTIVSGTYFQRIDFSFFGRSGSKTKNICIYNFINLRTYEYFSGMNCVHIYTNTPILNVNNINNIKYLITTSEEQINIKDSYNIENLSVCLLRKTLRYYGRHLSELDPIKMGVKNLHIIDDERRFNFDLSYIEKNGINVIIEKDPCNNRILKKFIKYNTP